MSRRTLRRHIRGFDPVSRRLIRPVPELLDDLVETPVDEDIVPFSDPQPTSTEVSESATELASDDEDETPQSS